MLLNRWLVSTGLDVENIMPDALNLPRFGQQKKKIQIFSQMTYSMSNVLYFVVSRVSCEMRTAPDILVSWCTIRNMCGMHSPYPGNMRCDGGRKAGGGINPGNVSGKKRSLLNAGGAS